MATADDAAQISKRNLRDLSYFFDLGSFEGYEVFASTNALIVRINTEKGSYALKIFDPSVPEETLHTQARFELDAINAGVPIAEPIFKDGHRFFPWGSDQRLARLSRWVAGEPLGNHDNGRRIMRELGTTMRALHARSQRYDIELFTPPALETEIAKDRETIEALIQSKNPKLDPLRKPEVLEALSRFADARAAFITDHRHWGIGPTNLIGGSVVIPKEEATEGEPRIVIIDWGFTDTLNLPLEAVKIGLAAERSRDSKPAGDEARTKRYRSYVYSYAKDEQTLNIFSQALNIVDLGEVFTAIRKTINKSKADDDFHKTKPQQLAALILYRDQDDPTQIVNPRLRAMNAAIIQERAALKEVDRLD